MGFKEDLKEDGQTIRVVWNTLHEMYEQQKGVETMEYENGIESKEQFLEFVSNVCKMIINSDKEEALDK